jgi:hypothetical protein
MKNLKGGGAPASEEGKIRKEVPLMWVEKGSIRKEVALRRVEKGRIQHVGGAEEAWRAFA